MPYKKKFNLKTAGNLAFSQTGSQFVDACAVDLRTSSRKGEGITFDANNSSSGDFCL